MEIFVLLSTLILLIVKKAGEKRMNQTVKTNLILLTMSILLVVISIFALGKLFQM